MLGRKGKKKVHSCLYSLPTLHQNAAQYIYYNIIFQIWNYTTKMR